MRSKLSKFTIRFDTKRHIYVAGGTCIVPLSKVSMYKGIDQLKLKYSIQMVNKLVT